MMFPLRLSGVARMGMLESLWVGFVVGVWWMVFRGTSRYGSWAHV